MSGLRESVWDKYAKGEDANGPRYMCHYKPADAAPEDRKNFADMKEILDEEFPNHVRQLRYSAGGELLRMFHRDSKIRDKMIKGNIPTATTEKLARLRLTTFKTKNNELKGKQLQCDTNVYLTYAERCRIHKELSEGTSDINFPEIFASLYPTLIHPIDAQGLQSVSGEDGFMRVQFSDNFNKDSGVNGIKKRAKNFGGPKLTSFEVRWTKEGKTNFEFKLPLSKTCVTNKDFAHLPCPVAKDRFNYDVHVHSVVSTTEQFFKAFADSQQNWNTVYVNDIELLKKLQLPDLRKNNASSTYERCIVVTVTHKDLKYLEVTYTVKESKPGEEDSIVDPVAKADDLLKYCLVDSLKCDPSKGACQGLEKCAYYHVKRDATTADIIKDVLRGEKCIDAAAKIVNKSGFKDSMRRAYSLLWQNIDLNFVDKNGPHADLEVAVVFENKKKEDRGWVVTHQRAAKMTRTSKDGKRTEVTVKEKEKETLEDGLKRSLQTVQSMYELLNSSLLGSLDCKLLTRVTVRYPPPVDSMKYCRFYGGWLAELSKSLLFALAESEKKADIVKDHHTSSKWEDVTKGYIRTHKAEFPAEALKGKTVGLIWTYGGETYCNDKAADYFVFSDAKGFSGLWFDGEDKPADDVREGTEGLDKVKNFYGEYPSLEPKQAAQTPKTPPSQLASRTPPVQALPSSPQKQAMQAASPPEQAGNASSPPPAAHPAAPARDRPSPTAGPLDSGALRFSSSPQKQATQASSSPKAPHSSPEQAASPPSHGPHASSDPPSKRAPQLPPSEQAGNASPPSPAPHSAASTRQTLVNHRTTEQQYTAFYPPYSLAPPSHGPHASYAHPSHPPSQLPPPEQAVNASFFPSVAYRPAPQDRSLPTAGPRNSVVRPRHKMMISSYLEELSEFSHLERRVKVMREILNEPDLSSVEMCEDMDVELNLMKRQNSGKECPSSDLVHAIEDTLSVIKRGT